MEFRLVVQLLCAPQSRRSRPWPGQEAQYASHSRRGFCRTGQAWPIVDYAILCCFSGVGWHDRCWLCINQFPLLNRLHHRYCHVYGVACCQWGWKLLPRMNGCRLQPERSVDDDDDDDKIAPRTSDNDLVPSLAQVNNNKKLDF